MTLVALHASPHTMWGGFGDALNKAAALASQTIQELDREAGLTDGDVPTSATPEEDIWNEDEEAAAEVDSANGDNVEEGWNEADDDLDVDESEHQEEKEDKEIPPMIIEPADDGGNDPSKMAAVEQDDSSGPIPSISNVESTQHQTTEHDTDELEEDPVELDQVNGGTAESNAEEQPAVVDPAINEHVESSENINGEHPNDVADELNDAEVHEAKAEISNVGVHDELDAGDPPPEQSNQVVVPPDLPLENEENRVTDDEPPQAFLPPEAFPSQPVDASLVQELKALLAEREGQLFSKTQQFSKLEDLYSSERQQLQQSHDKELKKIKDEAKRRMQAMRERVEAADALTAQMEGLREEGAKMARREADANEKAKRARSELKDMVEDFESTKDAEEKGRQRIAELEAQLKMTQDDLSLARKGESQAGKLDSELRDAREMSEKRAATILKLEQETKSAKSKIGELESALKNTEHHAAKETEEERRKLSQEKHDITLYWQDKLKQTEDEAEHREAKLQKSVDELRKSLTEAERRAHSTATEVESNTVPLLRKLEDAEARHRKRAAEWSESEAKYRQELNQSTEKFAELQSELSELQTVYAEADKAATEYQDTIRSLKIELEKEIDKASTLESKVEKLNDDLNRKKKEYERLEQSSNENASRIRSDLRRALHDAEETISSVRSQLEKERKTRIELEKDLDSRPTDFPSVHRRVESETTAPSEVESFKKEDSSSQRIRKKEGQAEILAGALGGLFGDDAEDESEDENLGDSHMPGQASGMSILQQSEMAKRASEVKELRSRLKALEDQNSKLLQTLGESRSAREELPEAMRRLEELVKDNEELRMENQALNEDLVDVRKTFQMTMDELISTEGKQENAQESTQESTLQTDLPDTNEAS